MRLIKMFGLTALTALASMAFLGAGSASANSETALCKVHTAETCALANRTKEIHMTAGVTQLLTSITTVLCLSSLVLGETEGEGLAKPLGVTIKEITWENCGSNAAHDNCTVTNLKLPLFDVLRTALNLGTATALGPEVLVNCSGFLHCKYGGAEVGPFSLSGAGHAGAGTGQFVAKELSVPNTGGFFCPATSKWDATYTSLPGQNIYVLK